jgi:hypothetical protein
LIGLSIAGYAGLPWWTVLPGAGALTLQAWRRKLWRPGSPRRERWSKKITAYFVTGIAADAVFAVTSFGIGRMARWALG